MRCGHETLDLRAEVDPAARRLSRRTRALDEGAAGARGARRRAWSRLESGDEAMRDVQRCWWWVVAVPLVGCSVQPASRLDEPPTHTLVTGPRYRVHSDGGVCPPPDAGVACGVAPLAPLDELCATPRANREAETLALTIAGTLVAPQALYERVDAALMAFRRSEPAVAHVYARNAIDTGVVLALDPDVPARLRSGADATWECLNTTYRAARIEVTDAVPGVLPAQAYVQFVGQYDADRLAAEYLARLAGVRTATRDGFVTDGPTLCMSLDGDGFFILVDDASGDCLSGCIERVERGYRVAADGSVTELGAYAPTEPLPAWRAAHRDCRLQY